MTNNPGLVAIRLGTARINKDFNKFLHIINLQDYQENIDKIRITLSHIKDKSTNNTLLNIIQLKFKELENLFKQVYPSRVKRGLIDGLGSVIKFITGNMDHEDAMTINKEIELLKLNENIVINENNKQVKINEMMTERFNNISNHINTQQDAINEILSSLKVSGSLTNREENFIATIQYAYQIIYNIDLLYSHLMQLAQALNLAKLNILPTLILSPDELDHAFDFLKSQNLPIKSTHQVYELLTFQAYYNNTNIIFNVRIPTFDNITYTVNLLQPLPKNNKSIVIPYPFILSGKNSSYFLQKECSQLNKIYICYKEDLIKIPSDDTCFTQAIQGQNGNCTYETADNSTTKKLTSQHIIVTNAVNQSINTNCGIKQRLITGTALIYFNNCEITINGIIYKNIETSTTEQLHVLPLHDLQIQESKFLEKMSLQKLTNFHINNREKIEQIKTTATIQISAIYILIGICVVAVLIGYIIRRKKNSTIPSQVYFKSAVHPNEPRLLWNIP